MSAPDTLCVLQQIANNAQRVSVATRSWPVQMPQRASFDAIEQAVADLQRDVAMLRNRMQEAPTR